MLESLARHPDVGATPNLSEGLAAESESVRQQKVELQSDIDRIQADVERLWADSTRAEYELCSVFMHRGAPCISASLPFFHKALTLLPLMGPGAANFGHYWLHQRALPGQRERWIKFNDASVSSLARPFPRVRTHSS